ncbi:MAG: tRNA (N(6)-L-threonylcarbamoyladenosine(37)-C(2))-methylthiotransferase [archaeon]|jgi:MiaB-like tRNA modifying enzyme
MNKFFVEGYGCSLNIGETEQIAGFLTKYNYTQVDSVKSADLIIVNTCSVKMVTEQRMLSRIQFLLVNKKKKAKLIITGCLAKTNNSQIQNISKELIVLDTKLESLAKVLDLKEEKFSPKIIEEQSQDYVSIIPISVGCMGNCTYCATKLARGSLHSYSIEEINNSFKRALAKSKEIWITSQDLGCYGFDTGHYLPELIKKLLENKGEYRIRLGMMNPVHFKKIQKDLMPLFSDDRLYKFLHLPVQSGSNKILKAMNRGKVTDFTNALNYIRKKVPGIRIATDIIVGFPGETKNDFKESIELIKKVRIGVVNISRFGKRKGTVADTLKNQLTEKEKKERSKELALVVKKILLQDNGKLIGQEGIALVSQKANKNGYIARTGNYAQVIVDSGFGEFITVKITSASSNFLKGEKLS